MVSPYKAKNRGKGIISYDPHRSFRGVSAGRIATALVLLAVTELVADVAGALDEVHLPAIPEILCKQLDGLFHIVLEFDPVPRFPDRYCDTAEGAISSIRAASTWETPHLTSSTAIAARIAGRTSQTIF